MMRQTLHHRSLLCSVWSHHLSSRVADSNRPGIREGDLLLSKVLKTLGFVVSLLKVSKKSGGLEEELDFILCNNITRSVNHNLQKSLCLYSLYRTSLPSSAIFDIILHFTINMFVALCTTLWSSTYVSPSSQLIYISQGCATSGILSLSLV